MSPGTTITRLKPTPPKAPQPIRIFADVQNTRIKLLILADSVCKPKPDTKEDAEHATGLIFAESRVEG